MKHGSLKMYMYRTHKVATSFVNTAPHYWNAQLPYEIRNEG